MDFKTKSKFLLVFGIIFVAFLLFNTNSVNATEISDYKCKIEKDDYIIYNDYFNTSDITFSGNRDIVKESVDNTTFNKIKNDTKNWLILVEIKDDVDSVKSPYGTKNYEIKELNGKKYAVIECEIYDSSDGELNIGAYVDIEMKKGSVTENKTTGRDISIRNEDYFTCVINVVSNTGKIYASSLNTNGYINGAGLREIPGKIDLNASYVEYLSNLYMGESIKVDCVGTVPYVGKYGNLYKYKSNLSNVKKDSDGKSLCLDQFSYKNSKGCGGFYLDDNYTIDNESYVEKSGTNSDTKLKYDLYGNFTGTLKVEEISKNDLIYDKVNKKLNIDNSNCLYSVISNVYIENGSFEGKLKLTFNVGEEYNGKNYSVVHMKSEKYDFEEFTGIVENGKIEITVDSLSPFGISIFEKETEQEETQTTEENTNATTNKGEKDVTPKTGTVDIIGYVLLGTVLSGVGIVALKKKF